QNSDGTGPYKDVNPDFASLNPGYELRAQAKSGDAQQRLSWPGIAVRKTASRRSPMSRPSRVGEHAPTMSSPRGNPRRDSAEYVSVTWIAGTFARRSAFAAGPA